MCRVHRSPPSAQATTCHVGTGGRGSPRFPSLETTILVPALRVVFRSWKLRREPTAHHSRRQALERQRGPSPGGCSVDVFSQCERAYGPGASGIIGKRSVEYFKGLEDKAQQAQCLSLLAMASLRGNQVDKAEGATSRAITLLTENTKPIIVSQCHEVPGNVFRTKGNIHKAIEHFEVALEIASSHNLHSEAFLARPPLIMLYAEG